MDSLDNMADRKSGANTAAASAPVVRDDALAASPPVRWLNRHPLGVVLVLFALLAAVALLWYPHFFQPGYQIASEAPFLQPKQDAVYLNSADATELMLLPGVGETKAKAIVAWREENGPFASPEQLLNVKGIGEKTLAECHPMILLD